MKPAAFDYRAPGSVDEAVDLLAMCRRPVLPLAGGQSLVPLMNLRRVRPATLIDLNRVPGLSGIRITPEGVRIGAMTSLRELETDPALRAALPVLPQAAGHVAHLQIRHRGTLGGSLCHAAPTAQLPAVAVALGARLTLRSQRGVRTEEAEGFFRGAHLTGRRPDELLTVVEFPHRRNMTYRFTEVTRRGGAGGPLVGVCLGVALDGPVVMEAVIAASGVAERPLRLPQAERALSGQRLDAPLDDVLEAAADSVDPPSDLHGSTAYRRDMLRTALAGAAAGLAAQRRPR